MWRDGEYRHIRCVAVLSYTLYLADDALDLGQDLVPLAVGVGKPRDGASGTERELWSNQPMSMQPS